MKYMWRWLMTGICWLVLAGISGAQTTAETSPNYRLSVQDMIQVTVFQEPDLTVQQRIDGQGQVRAALLGTVKLVGMTVREAELYLETQYVDQQYLRYPQVHVTVTQYAPKQISVLGQVNSPGQLTFPIEANRMDIVEVISRVGGFTDIAKSKEVRITRTLPNGQTRVLIENVDRRIRARDSADNLNPFYVLPGDVIYVDETVF